MNKYFLNNFFSFVLFWSLIIKILQNVFSLRYYFVILNFENKLYIRSKALFTNLIVFVICMGGTEKQTYF